MQLDTIILEENNLQLVKKIIKRCLGNFDAQVFLYGSRAKGTAWKYSDVDLALQASCGTIPQNVLAQLSLDFEESLLPYKVDIIDLNSVNENFKKLIEKDLVII